MDPDTAFRESLFDALADDEGADFWAGVYGQPIHVYSPYYPSSTSAGGETSNDADDNPKLERMTDDEYASYVRKKMWAKSHEYILEERRRREEARKSHEDVVEERRRREQRRKRKTMMEEEVMDEEGRKWQAGVEEALRRGEERRKKNRWKSVWERYLAGWEGRKGDISWPVESGKVKGVRAEEIEKFFKGVGGIEGVDLADVLKKERVRWHPDKIQQRAGEGGIDGGTMKVVTAVFQVVDRLWTEMRARA